MKNTILMALLSLSTLVSQAQRRDEVDSINALPYQVKVEKARTLDAVFLANARAAHRLGYIDGEAESYANAALAYYFQGAYDKDLSYSLKAIRFYQKSGNLERLAHHYAETGYRMKRRDMASAQAYMQKGKHLAEAHRFTKPLLALYNNYGVLKEMQGQLDSALFFYRKSLRLQQLVRDSVGIPYSLNNIAGIYLMRKQYDRVKPFLDEALAIRTRHHDKLGMAETFTALADLAAVKGNRPEAIRYYDKALALANEMGYLNLVANSHLMLSGQYEVLGKKDDALHHYKAYATFRDSLVNTETNKRIAELQVEFDTGEKEKQLALNKAALLEKEAEVLKSRATIAAVSLLTLFTAVCGFLLWRQQRMANQQQRQEFSLQAAIAQIESQNRLQEQRLAISRDLHDNIGAQLTFIISSVDSLRYGFSIKEGVIAQKLSSITDFTRSTIIELRDTIWAMNHADITFDDLKARILNFVEKAQEATDLRITFSVEDECNAVVLNSVAGMNLYRTLQEAVNNALKYANANTITIAVSVHDATIRLSVTDDGAGFDVAAASGGNGLVNMTKRMEDIGGRLSISSQPGEGTSVEAFLPFPVNHHQKPSI